MKKVFLISLILTALLIGLSVCIQAQNKKTFKYLNVLA